MEYLDRKERRFCFIGIIQRNIFELDEKPEKYLMSKKTFEFSLIKMTKWSHLSACLVLMILLSFNFGNDSTNSIKRVEAWGSVGHRAIASIALSYSSDETRAILKKYNKALNITSIVDIAD